MTTITSDHEYDSSRSGPAAPDSAYGGYQNNGQGYSQNSGNAGSFGGAKPEDDRKLFVGGLTADTTPDDLRQYFARYGKVVDCSIKQDPVTGRSRGFAFLVFESKDIVEKILSQNDHCVKGRKVDPKPAHRRSTVNSNQMTSNNNSHHHQQQLQQHNLSSQASLFGGVPSSTMPYTNMGMSIGASANPYSNNRKVFIGGLDPSFSDAKLRDYFSKFGKIDEIDLPYDKEKNERRPFCFISFQTEQAAQEVLRLQRHTIGEISVDVKRAKPKTSNNQQQQQQQLQQHMYDPYAQQVTYANYNTAIPSYGTNAYPAADPYANWNAYNYNPQANSAAYPYGGGSGSTGVSSPGTSSYSQYSEHPSNSQYPYQGNTGAPADYYSTYGYGGAQATSTYPDPNTYAANYDYASYYPQMNQGANVVSLVDNGGGQAPDNGMANPGDHENENHHGKSKTSIVASPTYHPYSRS